MYFIDTNICIYLLNKTSQNVIDRFLSARSSDIKIPAIVAAELLYGVNKSNRREYNLERYEKFLSVYDIVPFDKASAGRYAEIRASLERAGQTIGGNDMIIAASSLACASILVTNNVSEFSRVKGLLVEDWTKEIRELQ